MDVNSLTAALANLPNQRLSSTKTPLTKNTKPTESLNNACLEALSSRKSLLQLGVKTILLRKPQARTVLSLTWTCTRLPSNARTFSPVLLSTTKKQLSCRKMEKTNLLSIQSALPQRLCQACSLIVRLHLTLDTVRVTRLPPKRPNLSE